MVKFKLAFLASAAAALLTVSAANAQNADAGKALFNSRTCVACHTNTGTANRVGPPLFGVMGRKAGTVATFNNYSDDLKKAGFEWTPEKLDAWLTDPKSVIPSTKMVFAGMKVESERKDLIEYLKTLK
jgi:cytochrome c